MKKLACTVVVVIIVFSALMFVQPSHASTYVNSPITSNTTWTRANSTYQLTANVIVNQGVTLTIEAGTTVNFGNYQLQVNGILNAQGNSVNKIVFTGNSGSAKVDFSSLSTSSGCIIDSAIINYVTISVSGASPKISNNYITNNNKAITVSGGSPNILSNTIIFGQDNAIHITGGSPTISGNTISGAGVYDGIYIASSGSATITNNNILHGQEGIEALGYCVITQNNILNNINDGILTINPSSSVQNNAIANNKVGVSGTGGIMGIVQNNTISNNWNAGIWSPRASTIIRYNNIADNDQNIHLTENNTSVDATNNWWGTTDQASIDAKLWDGDNDPPNLGTSTVSFVPFLTQLNPNAPTVPSSITVPTPPPTPAPVSTASPTPTVSPTPRPNETSTPTQQPYQYPTATPYNYETATPTATPGEISNSGGEMDLTSVAVIAVAVMATLVIVFAINRTFARGSRTQPQPATNPT
jgi:parallel beta-helix repeat protein